MTSLRPVSPIRRCRGSVLIIVLWICLGLVALTLYFAHSMSTSLRAAENRVAEASARQAVAGGIRYAARILTEYAIGGNVPDPLDYRAEALAVGDATVWFIGRDPNNPIATEPYFGIVDEASKLNLNTARVEALEFLPGMTSEVAETIYSWAHSAAAISSNIDNTYAQLDPPRHNKGASFETVDELRLVYGVTPTIFFAEDTNRNGVLDRNEDDGEQSAPRDNQDGQLLAGVSEYVTVYSRLPRTSGSGGQRINIRGPLTADQISSQIRPRLSNRGITEPRLGQIVGRISANEEYTSVMAFLLDTQMTPEEFALVHTDFTVTQVANVTESGLVNVNTASEAVLACIRGIGPENASAIVAYRTTRQDSLTSFAWLVDVMRPQDLRDAGPYITDQSYQFSVDVAAMGRNGRGYARERVVFDTSSGTPRIVYRQDLTPYGWALGTNARDQIPTSSNL